MSLRRTRVLVMCCGWLGASIAPATVQAQWMGGWLFPPPAGCCVPPPVVRCAPPPVVVPQTCYQTVPITEYREIRQTVQRPVIETAYVDQPVTEYRTVVENKTAQIPTVSYQSVTEYRTVQRDCGRWVTQYRCRPKMDPCDYDPRGDVLGWLNRTSYSMRMAFTPETYAERVYVPNVIAQAVPYTRQVAVSGTRTVNYQVSRLVPYTTTRRVAVNSVKMVAQEVVTRQPVTVLKTVPVGTTLAMVPGWYGVPAQTVLAPVPDPYASAARPISPKTASPTPAPERSAKLPDALKEDPNDKLLQNKPGATAPLQKLSYPQERTADPQGSIDRRAEAPAVPGTSPAVATSVSAATPSAVTVGRWVARQAGPRVATPVPTPNRQPAAISLAGTASAPR